MDSPVAKRCKLTLDDRAFGSNNSFRDENNNEGGKNANEIAINDENHQNENSSAQIEVDNRRRKRNKAIGVIADPPKEDLGNELVSNIFESASDTTFRDKNNNEAEYPSVQITVKDDDNDQNENVQIVVNSNEAAVEIISEPPKNRLSLLSNEVLQKIFEYLTLYDLLQMIEVEPHFYEIITQNIVPNRILILSDIRRFYSVRKVFRNFGRFASHIDLKASDIQYKDEHLSHIDEMLRLINLYCSTDRLKSISLTFDVSAFKQDPVGAIEPIFRNIESLELKGLLRGTSGRFPKNVLSPIIAACGSLQTLQIKNMNTSGDWLLFPNLRRLETLSIDCCDLVFSSAENWETFLNFENKTLKSFEWIDSKINGHDKASTLLAHIGSALPDLCALSVQQKSPDDCHITVGEESVYGVNYLPTVQFNNLKELKMSVYSRRLADIDHIFDLLAQKNTVETLSIRFCDFIAPTPVEYYHTAPVVSSKINIHQLALNRSHTLETFRKFTSLRTIKIQNMKSESFAILSEYLCALPNLTECWLINNRTLSRVIISSIILLESQLQVLKIQAPVHNFDYKFYYYLTLKKKKHCLANNSPRLRIFLELKQFVKLRTENDINRYAPQYLTLCPFYLK